jgi:hypothetical protein
VLKIYKIKNYKNQIQHTLSFKINYLYAPSHATVPESGQCGAKGHSSPSWTARGNRKSEERDFALDENRQCSHSQSQASKIEHIMNITAGIFRSISRMYGANGYVHELLNFCFQVG